MRVDVDGFSDHVGCAGEGAMPESVAEDGDVAGAGLAVICWENRTAEARADLHFGVEVAGDQDGEAGLRETVGGDIQAWQIFVGEDRLHDFLLLAKLLVDRVGNGAVVADAVFLPGVSPSAVDCYMLVPVDEQIAELLGVGDAESYEEHLVGEGKDCGVGADG